MLPEIQFTAKKYQPFFLSDIVSEVMHQLTSVEYRNAIYTRNIHRLHGVGLLKKSRSNTVIVYSKQGVFQIEKQYILDKLTHNIFAITHSNYYQPIKIINIYNDFIFEVFHKVHTVLSHVLTYLYQHLSHRTYGMQAIVDLDTVKSDFSLIISELNCIECVLQDKNVSLDTTTLNHFSTVINRLIKLGGARSILPGNLMQFSYEFEMFKKIVG